MWFYPLKGELLCAGCAAGDPPSGGIALHAGALTALRHTIYAELPKLFSFTLGGQGQQELAQASEAYLLAQVERGFKSLDFYHNVTGSGEVPAATGVPPVENC